VEFVVEQLQAGDPLQVGGYRLLGRLGDGGMGRVFLGRSPGGRLVAVKVIRPELAGSPDFRSRFAREVAAARRVSGIFTAAVVDADPDAPEPWLVTGYVEGPSLADAVATRGPMPAAEVVALARGLAEGLAAIHAAGVVHRDLKPSNVLLARDGPRIIDFGISRAAEATVLTGTGIVVGSPGFMSPEQAGGREVGPASDIFSLGAVLAYAASGTDPFGTGSALALLYRVIHADPALEEVPPPLRSVLHWCMAKDPARRPSPADLLARLTPLGGEQLIPGPGLAAGQPGRPPPTEPADPARHRPPIPGRGLATTGLSYQREPATSVARRRQVPIRRGWRLAAAAAVICAAAGAGIVLAQNAENGPRQGLHARRGAVASARLSPPVPRAVVEEFIAAINARDWPRVWQLGGKNLGESYTSMVAGFGLTSHDVLTSLASTGNLVTARIRAYETTGAVQTYALNYTVRDGVITAGQQTLLSSQNPGGTSCPHIQYGADGTAGPLFCADGQPNPPVLAFYRRMHLRVLSLGADATPGQVLQAMCADLGQHATNPIETDAYDLAQEINKWSFGVSPPQEMLNGACRR
jgi:hypothetical protein